jgi:hypothetical protein
VWRDYRKLHQQLLAQAREEREGIAVVLQLALGASSISVISYFQLDVLISAESNPGCCASPSANSMLFHSRYTTGTFFQAFSDPS